MCKKLKKFSILFTNNVLRKHFFWYYVSKKNFYLTNNRTYKTFHKYNTPSHFYAFLSSKAFNQKKSYFKLAENQNFAELLYLYAYIYFTQSEYIKNYTNERKKNCFFSYISFKQSNAITITIYLNSTFITDEFNELTKLCN